MSSLDVSWGLHWNTAFSLKGKFDRLNEEKKLFEDLFHANKVNNKEEDVSTNPMKKVVYNNSSKTLSPKQQKVLELG